MIFLRSEVTHITPTIAPLLNLWGEPMTQATSQQFSRDMGCLKIMAPRGGTITERFLFFDTRHLKNRITLDRGRGQISAEIWIAEKSDPWPRWLLCQS